MKNLERYFGMRHAEEDFDDLPPICTTGVSVKGTHVFFYDEVSSKTVAELNKCLLRAKDNLYSSNIDSVIQTGTVKSGIMLHINSGGGDLIAGFAAYDFIQSLEIPVMGIVEGMAASAATLILCACTVRVMGPASFTLCHELTTGFWGKYSDLPDSMRNNDKFMEIIRRIYKKHTKIPEKLMNDLLSHDIFWDATDSLKYGLIDQIAADDDDDLLPKEPKKKPAKPAKKAAKKPAKDDEDKIDVTAEEKPKAKKPASKKSKKEN